jgi:hypothetical protein
MMDKKKADLYRLDHIGARGDKEKIEKQESRSTGFLGSNITKPPQNPEKSPILFHLLSEPVGIHGNQSKDDFHPPHPFLRSQIFNQRKEKIPVLLF